MPRLNGTGPDGKGPGTGRKLGRCSDVNDDEKLQKLGKGMGRKKHSGCGEGRGKRLRGGLNKE